MEPRKANEYLKNQVLTAPKEQLLLMLLDGAIRFAQQGKARLEEKKFEASCTLLIRAQRIMIELVTSLDREALPEDLYGNLVGLYNFVYFRLIDANLRKETGKIDDALRILNHLRETWALAIEQEHRRKFPDAKKLEAAQAARNILEMEG